MHYVYIIECQDGTFYPGRSEHIVERLLDHKLGNGAQYIKEHGFKRLAWFQSCDNEQDAITQEIAIRRSGQEKMRILTITFHRLLEFT
jgi:predicted GIY-YIG superfamily endonuclease